MAVINFPDPAGQNPPNTFGPNTTPAATSNGMTYEWTNGSWSIIGGGGGGGLNEGIADTLYVNIDGDNMVGNLTFDTDKITLGTDGSASFGGIVDVGGNPQAAEIGCRLRNDVGFASACAPANGVAFGVYEEGEEIEILELSFEDAKKLLKSDEVIDARTMILIQYMIINNLMD